MMPVPLQRSPRRALLLCGTVASAFAIGLGVGVAQAADPKLDEADAALEKAAALLDASQSGGVSDKAQKRFDRAIARALADVADARVRIVEAKDAVDNP